MAPFRALMVCRSFSHSPLTQALPDTSALPSGLFGQLSAPTASTAWLLPAVVCAALVSILWPGCTSSAFNTLFCSRLRAASRACLPLQKRGRPYRPVLGCPAHKQGNSPMIRWLTEVVDGFHMACDYPKYERKFRQAREH